MTLDRSSMFRFLEELDFGEGLWMVAGSGPLLAHGIIPSIADLDIVADALAWKRAIEFAGMPPTVGMHGDCLLGFTHRGVQLEVFDGWHGAGASKLIDRADIVEGHRFLPLLEVARFKRTLDRPKDRTHLALLEHHLGR